MGFYCSQKKVVLVMMKGLGNVLFVRQFKLMWKNQKLINLVSNFKESRGVRWTLADKSANAKFIEICCMDL